MAALTINRSFRAQGLRIETGAGGAPLQGLDLLAARKSTGKVVITMD